MAKTKNSGMVSLARLRGPIPDLSRQAAGFRRYASDYSDPQNLADVQEYLATRTIPIELLPAIAPLEVVYPDNDQRDAARAELIKGLRTGCQGVISFLPEKFQNNPSGIIPSQRRDQVIVQRKRSPGDAPRPAPLEIVVPESYRVRAYNRLEHGVGHYIYGPLSGQWLLVARWGRGPDINSYPITPHLRWEEAARLSRKMHDLLGQEPINSIELGAFNPANDQLVAQAQRAAQE